MSHNDGNKLQLKPPNSQSAFFTKYLGRQFKLEFLYAGRFSFEILYQSGGVLCRRLSSYSLPRIVSQLRFWPGQREREREKGWVQAVLFPFCCFSSSPAAVSSPKLLPNYFQHPVSSRRGFTHPLILSLKISLRSIQTLTPRIFGIPTHSPR